MSLQLENGQFTRIKNELLEQLVHTALLASEYQIVIFVIRKTYGWNKKSDIISFSQFHKGTGLSKTTINKTLKNLILKKILVRRGVQGKQEIAYEFNKYYEQWLVHPSGLVQNKMTTSTLVRLKPVQRGVHTKDNTKENKKEMNLKAKEAYKQLREKFGKKK